MYQLVSNFILQFPTLLFLYNKLCNAHQSSHGETEAEDISEVTQLYLKKANDQISRIKTIISGALRNRAAIFIWNPQQKA
jgi:hypothetical protein